LGWLLVVLPAAVLALSNWRDLSGNLADRVFAAGNLFMLWLLFPLIKLLHELGHGLATKMRGGEVHEAGVMLLVMMPVPYVDASAASAFRSKGERALVAAAGMLVELFLAALAMYVWLLVEPGLLRSLAFNTMLVAGVSTLIFNGNPLLRYDAYFILADLIEIPNLGQRANRYLAALAQRRLFGAVDVALPQASAGERRWFLAYAVASFAYRTWVSIAIVLFVASEFLVVGVILAAWGLVSMLVLPLARLARHLASDARLQRVRGRVLLVAGGGGLAALLFALVVPVPSRSQAQGVIWLPEQALIRAGANGFQSRYLVAPGQPVKRGDALLEGIDPGLQAQIRVSRARLDELQAQLSARWVSQPVEAELLRQDLAREQAVLDRLLERAQALTVLSPGDGVFLVPEALDQEGRFHHKGDLLGYIADRAIDSRDGSAQTVVRVVVQQGDVDLVRRATRQVELRHAYRPDQVLRGTIVREVPAGAELLPSRALAAGGGGAIAVDPRDSHGTRALQRSFQLDIALPADALRLYGSRVHVRFEHPAEPLAWQAWRAVHQLFLSRFHV
jgi:putative peptide zinc metalloprotease protein